MRRVTLTAVLLVTTLVIAHAQTPAPPRLASLDPADLDAFITAVAGARHAVGVTVGVMRNGEVIFARGYGLASTDPPRPVTPDTIFAAGSITKQFTCAVALLLEEAGKLSFGDPVAKYAPSLTRAHDITVGDLGSHLSGYRDYYPLDFVEAPMAQPRPSRDIVHDFARRPLDFEPRSRYSYSNTGYLLLGEIIEQTGGETFAAALQRRILDPLGLRHTRYEPARSAPGLAAGYTPIGLGPIEPAVPEGDGWIAAAGGLWSTPRDLLAWDRALMDGKVLSPASYRTMTSPRALSDGRSSGYGCGLSLRDRGPALVMTHGGAVSGFGARNAIVPSTRSAVVVMANTDWASSVLDTIQEAVLAKLVPVSSAPAIASRPARDVTLALLDQIRRGALDRSQLSPEFSAYLTPARLAIMARSLAEAGPVSVVAEHPLRERGGMEVSGFDVTFGATAATTSMYRTPDGKIHQFLFNRR